MKYKSLSAVFILCALAWPLPSTAQDQPSNAETQAPVLTLDEAVTLALQYNRLVKNSALEAQKYDFQVSTARSRRKPQFQFSMLGGELLHPFDFTFQKVSFGTYPGRWSNPWDERQSPHASGIHYVFDWQHRSTADTAIQDRPRNSRNRAGT